MAVWQPIRLAIGLQPVAFICISTAVRLQLVRFFCLIFHGCVAAAAAATAAQRARILRG